MYFHYKNTTVYYRIKGNLDGPTVLLIHGFTEDGKMWKPLTAELDAYRYIIPDLLGHGKSGYTGNVLTMEEQAEMLRNLLDFQGVDRAILVGHSMGGYISLAFAEMFSRRTAGILLYHSKPQADDPAKAHARETAIADAINDKTAFLSRAIPGFFAPYNRETYAAEIRRLVRRAARMPVQGIAGALRGMKIRKDRSHLFFGKNPFPTGWIIGRDDPLVDAEALAREATGYPHVFFRMIESGHMSYVENPEAMIEAVQAFLKSF